MGWFSRAALAFVVSGASVAMAGRPLTIDDAGVRQKGEFQLSCGLSYAFGPEATTWNAPLTLGYGLTESLELDIGAGWLWQRGIDDQDLLCNPDILGPCGLEKPLRLQGCPICSGR